MEEKNGKAKYDWDKIKRDFFNSDFLEVASFIQQELGKLPEDDGNMAQHTKGWAEDKREKKRKDAEEIEEQMKKELIERLKVKMEDVLTGKKISFELLLKYVECQLKEANGQELSEADLKFMKRFSGKEMDNVIKWFQIELGQPTNIAQLQGSKERPIVLIDLLERARKLRDVIKPE